MARRVHGSPRWRGRRGVGYMARGSVGRKAGRRGGGRNDADYTESQQMIQLLLQLGQVADPESRQAAK